MGKMIKKIWQNISGETPEKKEERRDRALVLAKPPPYNPDYPIVKVTQSNSVPRLLPVTSQGSNMEAMSIGPIGLFEETSSAPIEKVQPKVVKKDTWSVVADITLMVNNKLMNWEDLLSQLDIMLDEYSGSQRYKPFFLAVYYLISTHMNIPPDYMGGCYLYKGSLEERIVFHHTFTSFPEDIKRLEWSHSHWTGSNKIRIRFNCEMKDTARTGKNFSTLYLAPVSEHNPPPPLAPLMEAYGYSILTDKKGNYIFNKEQN
ncbi:MAG: M protein [Apis rhabdovirus 3]|uniref:Matrix protein n=1 Tax=Apis rhabdovirus 3 TaxID=2873557 RepID=A0A8K1J663_9RHAB|nr:MAG: M protein [Apis rhabdovirus 3]UCR92529.1 MAG: M protein [Apis rhabdovirus 3]